MDRVLRPVSPTESLAAQRRLQGHVLHSPIVKLQWQRQDNGKAKGPEIYLKLENLQAINRDLQRSHDNLSQINSKFKIYIVLK